MGLPEPLDQTSQHGEFNPQPAEHVNDTGSKKPTEANSEANPCEIEGVAVFIREISRNPIHARNYRRNAQGTLMTYPTESIIDHAYYFGCGSGPGHYLHSRHGQTSRKPKVFPIARYETLDGGFLPESVGAGQVEGDVHLWRTNGWAIIAFWDRSEDRRPGSNSAFVLQCNDDESLEALLERLRKIFPWVFDRQRFRLTYKGTLLVY